MQDARCKIKVAENQTHLDTLKFGDSIGDDVIIVFALFLPTTTDPCRLMQADQQSGADSPGHTIHWILEFFFLQASFNTSCLCTLY